jgi:hypothetical protein
MPSSARFQRDLGIRIRQPRIRVRARGLALAMVYVFKVTSRIATSAPPLGVIEAIVIGLRR